MLTCPCFCEWLSQYDCMGTNTERPVCFIAVKAPQVQAYHLVHTSSYIVCSYFCAFIFIFPNLAFTFVFQKPDQRSQHSLRARLRGRHWTARPRGQQGAQLSFWPCSFSSTSSSTNTTTTTSSSASSSTSWTRSGCSSSKQEPPGESRERWFYRSVFDYCYVCMYVCVTGLPPSDKTRSHKCVECVFVLLHTEFRLVGQDVACWHIWALKLITKNAALRLQRVCVCGGWWVGVGGEYVCVHFTQRWFQVHGDLSKQSSRILLNPQARW